MASVEKSTLGCEQIWCAPAKNLWPEEGQLLQALLRESCGLQQMEHPMNARRERISPAARAVKVSAKTLCGSMVPIAAAYAMR
jgi:hypothetical protein